MSYKSCAICHKTETPICNHCTGFDKFEKALWAEDFESEVRTNERANITEEVDLHLREAGYTFDSNMGIGDNIGSALLKEYANGYIRGEQDGRADERAKTIDEVIENIIPTLCEHNVDKEAINQCKKLFEQMKGETE